MQHLFAIEGRKEFCRRFAAKLFPSVGIDVRHHEVDILLSQMVKGSAGRENLANKLMISFNMRFLSRRIRIAIEEMNVIMLNSSWIGELCAIIGKKDGEHIRETRLKALAKRVKAGNDRGCGIGIPQESNHEIARCEVKGKESFSANPADDAVNLNNGLIRCSAQ